MKKQQLAKNIIHYRFDPRPGRVWDTSATAILNGSKAMLIDTGYETQTPAMLEDLAKDNIEVEAVIITHFHDDHMEGLRLLPGVPVYGSGQFQDALDKWTPKEHHKCFTPTIRVDAPLSLSYGEHNLTLIPHPGHSKCGMLIDINNQFLHIGDEMVFSAKGKPILPSLDMGDAQAHFDSLEGLRGYGKFTIIPSHGPVFDGGKLADEIKDRLAYLKALIDSNRDISFEDATKDCACTFLCSDWHEDNCE